MIPADDGPADGVDPSQQHHREGLQADLGQRYRYAGDAAQENAADHSDDTGAITQETA